jgi:DNA-binding transcriptional LysR family regulator
MHPSSARRTRSRRHRWHAGPASRAKRHLLGEPLLARDSRAVELTEAGTRFLPHARALLIAADSAVAETRSISRPVRVDIWGHLHAPLRWMRRLTASEPSLTIEVSMRHNVYAAIDALTRGEIDVAFGRIYDLSQPVPDDLGHRLVLLGPMGALLSIQHPLAQTPPSAQPTYGTSASGSRHQTPLPN